MNSFFSRVSPERRSYIGHNPVLHAWVFVAEPWQFAPLLFDSQLRVRLWIPPPQTLVQFPNWLQALHPQVVLPSVQAMLSVVEPWQLAPALFESQVRVRIWVPSPQEFEHASNPLQLLQPQVVLPAVQAMFSVLAPWQFSKGAFEEQVRVRVWVPSPQEFEQVSNSLHSLQPQVALPMLQKPISTGSSAQLASGLFETHDRDRDWVPSPQEIEQVSKGPQSVQPQYGPPPVQGSSYESPPMQLTSGSPWMHDRT